MRQVSLADWHLVSTCLRSHGYALSDTTFHRRRYTVRRVRTDHAISRDAYRQRTAAAVSPGDSSDNSDYSDYSDYGDCNARTFLSFLEVFHRIIFGTWVYTWRYAQDVGAGGTP